MTTETLSQPAVTIEIERLVHAIEYSHDPAFRITIDPSGKEITACTRLTHHTWKIKQMYDFIVAADGYEMSEYLRAFQEGCQDVGIEFSPLVGITCLDESESRYLSPEETLSLLVERIREHTRCEWYQRKQHDRSYQAKRNERAAESYLNKMLERHARLMIVRVDLSYLREAFAALRVEQVFQDFDRLMVERKRSSVFKHEVGHICSVEQDESGFHIRTTFFFDATYVRSDWNKARSIGELWRWVTAGRGGYSGWNHNKNHRANELGIGLLDRADEATKEDVVHVMRCVARTMQPLRIKPVGAKRLRVGLVRGL